MGPWHAVAQRWQRWPLGARKGPARAWRTGPSVVVAGVEPPTLSVLTHLRDPHDLRGSWPDPPLGLLDLMLWPGHWRIGRQQRLELAPHGLPPSRLDVDAVPAHAVVGRLAAPWTGLVLEHLAPLTHGLTSFPAGARPARTWRTGPSLGGHRLSATFLTASLPAPIFLVTILIPRFRARIRHVVWNVSTSVSKSSPWTSTPGPPSNHTLQAYLLPDPVPNLTVLS